MARVVEVHISLGAPEPPLIRDCCIRYYPLLLRPARKGDGWAKIGIVAGYAPLPDFCYSTSARI